ncbi:two-component system histidine kinase PnpS [Sulfoacidibacillus ferrooxidans]|uniref:histidine kinase n=1 Tax=Sulfoacidibacillus ferrooxidans TaxID=2005001 RepID=A0A9X2ABU7_9BACL|nr:Alkaline phosphatase synthesis sensor protein PhoR [Sulfoacidibacillus ferrooxidans]
MNFLSIEPWIVIGAICVVPIFYTLYREYHVRKWQHALAQVLDAGISQRELPARIAVGGRELHILSRVYELAELMREAREETMQERSKLEGIMEPLVSGVIVIDRAGKIVLVNAAVQRLLSLNEDDMVGRWHWEAGHHYGLASLVDEAIAYGVVQKREVQLHKPQELTLEAHVTPIKQSNGSIAGAVVLLHDVSEWRRLERMRSDFVANVSHELRTPITALKGFAETLLDGALLDQTTARQFVQIMQDEADRIGRLVEDLLDLSRIEAKQIDLHLAPVEAEWIMQRVVDTFSGHASDAGVALAQEVIGRGPIVALADSDRLRQVLINLVNNALQFTPAGGSITLTAERKGDRIVFAVQDSGVGIPPADAQRVFERFYRVDKTRSRQSGGTGLGLAIVKHLVESHGGHVGVYSEVGQGSRFFFDVASVDADGDEL